MPTNFVLAHVLMYLSRHEIRSTDRVLSQPMLLAWLFSALIFCPVTGWSFYAYPAWATVYLRPEFLIPVWSGPLIVSFYFLGMVFGTWIARGFLRTNQMNWFWLSCALGVFWLLTTTALSFDEYQHIGTYAAYHGGQAQLIFENPAFMRDLNIMGALIGIPGVTLAIYFVKRDQSFKKA